MNKRYIFDNCPDTFLNSRNWYETISNYIVDLEFQIDAQQNIDSSYDKFCKILTNEMDQHLQYRELNKSTRKRLKNSKPFWCDELDILWKNLRNSEKCFRKCKDSNKHRNKLFVEFKTNQNLFDKRLRQIERNYNYSKITHIENVCTKNPKEFWHHIKNLGPRQHTSIPTTVKDSSGNLISDPDAVCNQWKNEFESLYNNPNNDMFDNEFREQKNSRIT